MPAQTGVCPNPLNREAHVKKTPRQGTMSKWGAVAGPCLDMNCFEDGYFPATLYLPPPETRVGLGVGRRDVNIWESQRETCPGSETEWCFHHRGCKGSPMSHRTTAAPRTRPVGQGMLPSHQRSGCRSLQRRPWKTGVPPCRKDTN